MNPDPFASPIISLILTWLISGTAIFWILFMGISTLFEKAENPPRLFTIWIFINLLLFSPIRYIVLQLLMASSFPLQSLAGLAATFILTIYVPIVFIILYAIGFGLPLLVFFLIIGLKETPSKIRTVLAGIMAPGMFFVGSLVFNAVLPYAAYSTHWVKTEAIIRTTNGPSEYFYKFVVEPFTTIRLHTFVEDIGFENLSSKEQFRAHVASIYCGKEQLSCYIYRVYPDYFDKITKQKSLGPIIDFNNEYGGKTEVYLYQKGDEEYDEDNIRKFVIYYNEHGKKSRVEAHKENGDKHVVYFDDDEKRTRMEMYIENTRTIVYLDENEVLAGAVAIRYDEDGNEIYRKKLGRAEFVQYWMPNIENR
jgi:hypothetical protein